MKYEEIEKVNKAIDSTEIKGKKYTEVNQRIKAFRMLYPQGFIKTELLSNESNVAVIKATAGFYENEKEIILGTGLAYEKEGSTFVNETSYIENCETSAVGRALAMCGIGSDKSVASVEEVINSINNQNKKEAVKKEKDYKKELIEFCKEKNIDLKEIAKEFKLNSKTNNDEFKKVYEILVENKTDEELK